MLLLLSCFSRVRLCNPIDGSPPGSAIPGILQARTLEGVAISLSNAWKWKVKVKLLSRVWLLATSWTEAYQAPPSMGFSRQEHWSGVPFSSFTRSFHSLLLNIDDHAVKSSAAAYTTVGGQGLSGDCHCWVLVRGISEDSSMQRMVGADDLQDPLRWGEFSPCQLHSDRCPCTQAKGRYLALSATQNLLTI